MTDDAAAVEMDVAVRHGRMHCTLHGKGEPLVLLHGALGTGEAHFRRQIDELARGYRLIVLDFLGYGRSGRRDLFDGTFHSRDAEDVIALIEQLGVSPVHLCGFSDGAIVAMVVATRYGEHLRSLTLIGGESVLDEKGMAMTREWVPPEQLSPGFQEALARYHGDPYWSEMVTQYVNAFEMLWAAGRRPGWRLTGSHHVPYAHRSGRRRPVGGRVERTRPARRHTRLAAGGVRGRRT